MRKLISGGGLLAGLTLAYWLHQYGYSPVALLIAVSSPTDHDGNNVGLSGSYDRLKQLPLDGGLMECITSFVKQVALKEIL